MPFKRRSAPPAPPVQLYQGAPDGADSYTTPWDATQGLSSVPGCATYSGSRSRPRAGAAGGPVRRGIRYDQGRRPRCERRRILWSRSARAGASLRAHQGHVEQLGEDVHRRASVVTHSRAVTGVRSSGRLSGGPVNVSTSRRASTSRSSGNSRRNANGFSTVEGTRSSGSCVHCAADASAGRENRSEPPAASAVAAAASPR
jgi:hypothetical protein